MVDAGSILAGVLGGLLLVSEALGMNRSTAANGIVHGAYLFFKHLDEHGTIDVPAVVDSLEEALIDEVDEHREQPRQ